MAPRKTPIFKAMIVENQYVCGLGNCFLRPSKRRNTSTVKRKTCTSLSGWKRSIKEGISGINDPGMQVSTKMTIIHRIPGK
jgi:hypothetical protein